MISCCKIYILILFIFVVYTNQKIFVECLNTRVLILRWVFVVGRMWPSVLLRGAISHAKECN